MAVALLCRLADMVRKTTEAASDLVFLDLNQRVAKFLIEKAVDPSRGAPHHPVRPGRRHRGEPSAGERVAPGVPTTGMDLAGTEDRSDPGPRSAARGPHPLSDGWARRTPTPDVTLAIGHPETGLPTIPSCFVAPVTDTGVRRAHHGQDGIRSRPPGDERVPMAIRYTRLMKLLARRGHGPGCIRSSALAAGKPAGAASRRSTVISSGCSRHGHRTGSSSGVPRPNCKEGA